LDVVLHQLMGENGGPGVFEYLGADGKRLNGRGAMHPGCFRGGTGSRDPIPPFRPEDAVPSRVFDFPFGREKVYQNCEPARYTIDDAIDYGDWLFRTTDADGLRFDDCKGTWTPFVAEFMRSKAMASKFAYAEYFEGNPEILNAWATREPMSSRSLIEDFTLHWALQAACDAGNVSGLNGAGYTTKNPFLSCTFVDNPDTDTSPGQQIISNKLLAYAFILTIEGYPFIYGKDYFGDDVWPGAYGLKPWLDNLIWIHENLAAGGTVTQFVDDAVIVLNRIGDPGLLTALSFDTKNSRHVKCGTSFGPNIRLHDYTGRHPDIWTDQDGFATFLIPSNTNRSGQSYLCFSHPGHGSSNLVRGHSTSQTFFGADDLDILPLGVGSFHIGRVFSERGTPVRITIKPMGVAWKPGAKIRIEVLTDGSVVLGRADIVYGEPSDGLEIRPDTAGWCTIRGTGFGLSDALPYELTVNYTAPQQVRGV
jgi:alpha-amylase